MKTHVKKTAVTIAVLFLTALTVTIFPNLSAQASTTINIDGTDTGRTFEGIGGISSNGMTKLLKEYPEEQQADIIDFLFKPYFGASLQHLKIEIGSDANGTSGTEPSHMRSETDFDITRGVGLWLAQQAKAENLDIMLDAIRWGTPAWITTDSQKFTYYLNFLQGARDVFGLEFDYISADENEGDFSRNWVVNTLRPGLDSNGFSDVEITAADSTTDWGIADLVSSDTSLKNALYSINMHYRQDSPSNAKTCDLPIWDSEDVAPYRHEFSYSLDMAYKIIKSYASGKMVKYEIHPVIEASYDDTPYSYKSILTAAQPWTGHYDVEPGLWVIAQFTQFIQPGWTYLDDACSYSTNSGYITLKNPDTDDYSVIILNRGTTDLDYHFNISGGLSTDTVHVWGTDEDDQFYTLSDITPVSGSFSVTVPAGSIYSLTTTTGQQKGEATYEDPEEAEFDLPYTDTFENYEIGKQPLYTIDQSGAFEIAEDGANQYLRQVITADIKPVDWERRASPSPYTLLGGQEWKNYQIDVDVRLEDEEGYVMVGGRTNFSPTGNVPPESYNLRVFYDGSWELRRAALVLDSGTLSSFSSNTWYHVKMIFDDDSIKAYFNGNEIASVNDTEIPSGHIVLGSGYVYAGFDNLSITPVDASTPTSCVRYEERDERVKYFGTWEESGSNAKNYTRTLLTSGSKDHYLEFAFNGTAVSVLGMISTDCGKADVYVDDIYQETIDAYSDPTKYRKSLFSAYGLASGDHTLRLVVTETKSSSSTDTNIYVDAIEITGGTGLLDLEYDPMPDDTASAITLFTDNLEEETLGQVPSGWTVTAASGTSGLTASVAGETNQCIKLYDNSTSGIVSAYRAFDAEEENLTVEYRFYTEATGKWSRLYVKDGTTNVIELYDSNVNGLCYRNSSASDIAIASISSNTWYTIKLDIDVAANTFNIYLDGELMLSNCSFRRTATQIDGISFESGQSFIGTSYFDDIFVGVEDLVHDSFDESDTAATPIGWSVNAPSGTLALVEDYPDASDKSLMLEDSNTSAAVIVSKPFAGQAGILVAEYDFYDSGIGTWSRFFLQNGSTNAIEIYNSDIDGLCYRDGNGNNIKITDISGNTWYTVKIVADVSLDRFDIYINDTLMATGCSFRNIVSKINSITLGSGESYTGTTYFNSVSVLKE